MIRVVCMDETGREGGMATRGPTRFPVPQPLAALQTGEEGARQATGWQHDFFATARASPGTGRRRSEQRQE